MQKLTYPHGKSRSSMEMTGRVADADSFLIALMMPRPVYRCLEKIVLEQFYGE